MPRAARFMVDGGCYHILTRGNNRATVFHDEADFQHYGQLLLTYFADQRLQLYHYCLMSNHVHLIVEAPGAAGLTKAMHGLNLSYALGYRRRYGHVGHFWQDRFKSLLIAKDDYLLQCGAYVELNPVRARMVAEPAAYAWSSYRLYAFGADDRLVRVLNPVYLALGRNLQERRQRYREYVERQLTGTPRSWLLQPVVGSAAFREELAKRVGRRVEWRPRGRPRKPVTEATEK